MELRSAPATLPAVQRSLSLFLLTFARPRSTLCTHFPQLYLFVNVLVIIIIMIAIIIIIAIDIIAVMIIRANGIECNL